MGQTISISEQVYTALQRQAERSSKSLDALAELFLKQHLDIERYPDLEWRQGPGGWRVGIKDTAIDIYTVVGYSRAGYSPQEIAEDVLPQLSLQQVHAALRYYADYPGEVDQILAENETETSKAWLYRTLGPAAYRRLTNSSGIPRAIREADARYGNDAERSDEED